MKKGKGKNNGLLPNSFKIISYCIKTVSTNASTVVRTVGAFVAASISATTDDQRDQDENGNKLVNECVREYKIGSGSYGKVVLYRSQVDGNHYAIKAFHKSHLLKLRVAPSETAMTDVLREVLIMKMLNHPNIVNLIEVIDDPNADHFYIAPAATRGLKKLVYILNEGGTTSY